MLASCPLLRCGENHRLSYFQELNQRRRFVSRSLVPFRQPSPNGSALDRCWALLFETEQDRKSSFELPVLLGALTTSPPLHGLRMGANWSSPAQGDGASSVSGGER
jgi:hypothetical protein